MLVPVPIGGAFRLKYPSRLRTCHQSAEFVEVEYAWDTPLNISDWENTTEVYASHPHIPGGLWIDEFSQPSYDMCYLQILQQLQVCCCRLVCVVQCVCMCVCVRHGPLRRRMALRGRGEEGESDARRRTVFNTS